MIEFIECPVCHKVTRCEARKDFESVSGAEYAEHIRDKHPDQVTRIGETTMVPYGKRVCGTIIFDDGKWECLEPAGEVHEHYVGRGVNLRLRVQEVFGG